jgi:hypothetical protein
MRPEAVCLLGLMAVGCGLTAAVDDNPRPVVRAEQLSAGTRVRVHTRSQGKVIGHLVRVTSDSIVLRPGNQAAAELALPAPAVKRVDLSTGRRSRKGRGVLIGLLVGTVGGYAVLLRLCADDCVGAWPLLGLPVGGALVGAGMGAAIGSGVRTERWQRVSWP